ncbi:MAG TPA: cytochrome c biogenesis protein CcdA [Anaerolineales bacterium]|nr:cytochrome c biogenesis protein CcdA [Anaerolineales bacterium]HMS00679.1 cytochrome c biogenesis protein CcdA [Anaerolineales bacterium]HNQ95191.1 cytochrome c biogenesis protein CcdA [Anaerolineales bacterium]HNS60922.1 cytochrome c biogenesis protein CcdA [Anaerolineales bacterium]
MEFTQISMGLAFLAGLASFLSPCVFSLVPAYVGYLGGRAAGGEATENNRFITFTHGLAFVLGFSLVFITLGVATSAAGRLLYDLRFILSKVGGAVVIIFGLHMIGVFRIPFLEYDTRVQQLPDRKLGYLSSALMGVFFSAGWSPCVGPVLGAILTLVLNGGSVSQGVSLLSAYSAGLGIPFLIAALGVGWVSLTLRKYGKMMRYVEIVMGVVLIIVGIMLIGGIFERIAASSQFFWINFGL